LQNSDSLDSTPTNESNQSEAQIQKNRQKIYSGSRRPISTRVTTTPNSEDVHYTIRPRNNGNQVEDTKLTKSRSRLRRPNVKRRTTTTTASTLDTNNELPLDEQYSRTVSHGFQEETENIQNPSDNDRNPVVYEKSRKSVQNKKHEDDLTNENVSFR
jgi:hypothetical protein